MISCIVFLVGSSSQPVDAAAYSSYMPGRNMQVSYVDDVVYCEGGISRSVDGAALSPNVLAGSIPAVCNGGSNQPIRAVTYPTYMHVGDRQTWNGELSPAIDDAHLPSLPEGYVRAWNRVRGPPVGDVSDPTGVQVCKGRTCYVLNTQAVNSHHPSTRPDSDVQAWNGGSCQSVEDSEPVEADAYAALMPEWNRGGSQPVTAYQPYEADAFPTFVPEWNRGGSQPVTVYQPIEAGAYPTFVPELNRGGSQPVTVYQPIEAGAYPTSMPEWNRGGSQPMTVYQPIEAATYPTSMPGGYDQEQNDNSHVAWAYTSSSFVLEGSGEVTNYEEFKYSELNRGRPGGSGRPGSSGRPGGSDQPRGCDRPRGSGRRGGSSRPDSSRFTIPRLAQPVRDVQMLNSGDRHRGVNAAEAQEQKRCLDAWNRGCDDPVLEDPSAVHSSYMPGNCAQVGNGAVANGAVAYCEGIPQMPNEGNVQVRNIHILCTFIISHTYIIKIC